ncbi:MAG: hypothetical protein Q4G69_04645 [Planctomycetia bacterium]|nr:hypothetical protein [Planctomycetia bacterium]
MKKDFSNDAISHSGKEDPPSDPISLFPKDESIAEKEFLIEEDLPYDDPDEEKELLDEDLSEEDELLIGWLDKELSGDQRSLFEKRLAESPELRKKLEDLRKTWDLLGSLQTDPVGSTLTQSTMEMAAVAANDEITQKKRGIQRSRKLFFVLSLILLLLAVGIGTVFGLFFLPNPEKQIKKDIPVILLLDQLETVGNFDFLLRLKDSELFLKEVRSFPRRNFPMGKESLKNDRIPENNANYSLEQLQEDPDFPRLFMKFGRFTPARKEEFRKFYEKIMLSSDNPILLRTMKNYYNWFCSEVHETVRDEIGKLSPDKKLEKIQFLITEYRRGVQKRMELTGQKDHDGKFSRIPRNPSSAFPFDNSNPYEAGKKELRFREKLPKELRKEDLSTFKPEFDEFVKKRSEKRPPQNGEGPPQNGNSKNKTNAGKKNNAGKNGFFDLITEFIVEKSADHFIERLTPEAQKYMKKLSDREKIKMIGLLFTLELHKGIDFRNITPFPYGNGKKNVPPGQNYAPRGEVFKENSQWNRFREKDPRPEGVYRMSESTSELAETLRRLPQKQRDELLSLPAEEMYAQLLILHWGFAPQKGINRFPNSDRPKDPGQMGNQNRPTDPSRPVPAPPQDRIPQFPPPQGNPLPPPFPDPPKDQNPPVKPQGPPDIVKISRPFLVQIT